MFSKDETFFGRGDFAPIMTATWDGLFPFAIDWDRLHTIVVMTTQMWSRNK